MSDPTWPVSVEKIDEVIFTWQNPETVDGVAEDATDAEALIQALAHHGLQILPIAPDDDLFVVEVDGEPVSRPHMRSPHSSNEAAGLWVSALAERRGRVVLRPANDDEIAADKAHSRDVIRRDLPL